MLGREDWPHSDRRHGKSGALSGGSCRTGEWRWRFLNSHGAGSMVHCSLMVSHGLSWSLSLCLSVSLSVSLSRSLSLSLSLYRHTHTHRHTPNKIQVFRILLIIPWNYFFSFSSFLSSFLPPPHSLRTILLKQKLVDFMLCELE